MKYDDLYSKPMTRGTEKQIAWAMDIRRRALDIIRNEQAAAVEAYGVSPRLTAVFDGVLGNTDANYWITCRSHRDYEDWRYELDQYVKHNIETLTAIPN